MTRPVERYRCCHAFSLCLLLFVVVIGWIAATAAAAATSNEAVAATSRTHDDVAATSVNPILIIRNDENDRHRFATNDNFIVDNGDDHHEYYSEGNQTMVMNPRKENLAAASVIGPHVVAAEDEKSTMIATTITTTNVSLDRHIEAIDDDDIVVVITSSSTHSYRNHTKPALSQERNLQSCVTSVDALKAAVAKGSSQIRVCTSKIKLGSLNHRRRSRDLGSDEERGLQGVLTGLGGGIDVSNRIIVFTCLLKKRCVLDGEGISRIFYGTNATLLIDGFQFYNASSAVNDALGSGSALTLIGSSKIAIKDCSFHYNMAPNGGGAIMMNNSQLFFKSSHRKIRFLKNRAQYGGAIYGINDAQMKTKISSSTRRRKRSRILEDHFFVTFENNYARQDGGAVHFTGGVVTLDQVNLEDNTAASSGGAMVLVDVQSAVMTKLDCGDNQANVTGGAFVFQDSNVTIANSTFTSNDSNGTIGAVLVKYTADVTTSTVQSLSSSWINSCWVDGSLCEDGRNCGSHPLCGPNVTGKCCDLDLTCDVCCHGGYNWWYKPQPFQSYAVCGPQPCWDDWTYCVGQLSCEICCNNTPGVAMFQSARCGLPACYSDGTACEDGITCDRCCNTATLWSRTVTSGYYCGNEP